MMTLYTAFCRDKDNTGTTWIGEVEADDIHEAANLAETACASDWDWEPWEVKCIGLAKGEVSIEYWDDIE